MLALTGLLAVLAAGCGQSAEAGDDAGLSLEDGWVRATGDDMTATFGTLVNNTDEDIVVVGGDSDIAGMVELHEVVMTEGEMLMRPKDGGFVVPAGGRHVLEPGGDHVMLMELTGPVEPGEDVSVTLNAADGNSWGWSVQAREFDGAAEDYQPGSEATHDMSGMEPSDGSGAAPTHDMASMGG